MLHDESPGQRTEQRRTDEREGELADVPAAFAWRQDVAEDGERQRLDRAAAETVDRANRYELPVDCDAPHRSEPSTNVAIVHPKIRRRP